MDHKEEVIFKRGFKGEEFTSRNFLPGQTTEGGRQKAREEITTVIIIAALLGTNRVPGVDCLI